MNNGLGFVKRIPERTIQSVVQSRPFDLKLLRLAWYAAGHSLSCIMTAQVVVFPGVSLSGSVPSKDGRVRDYGVLRWVLAVELQ
jgi:hypothetical protein